MSGVNRRTDRRILKIFLSGFRIQSEIFTDFRILQFQRIADSSIFWARILDFPCIENFFAWISDSGRFRAKMAGRIWLINYNGSADLHTPIHAPPSPLSCRKPRFGKRRVRVLPNFIPRGSLAPPDFPGLFKFLIQNVF